MRPPWRAMIAAGLLVVLGTGLVAAGPGTGVRGATPALPAPVSRLVRGDREYVKINTVELFGVSERRDPAEMGRRYVVRGVVLRLPVWDGQGTFLLVRTLMWCCRADARYVGLRVRHARAHWLKHGRWVRVFGRLDRQPLAFKNFIKKAGKIHFFAVINREYVLTADRVEPIPPPGDPDVVEVRRGEPFAY